MQNCKTKSQKFIAALAELVSRAFVVLWSDGRQRFRGGKGPLNKVQGQFQGLKLEGFGKTTSLATCLVTLQAELVIWIAWLGKSPGRGECEHTHRPQVGWHGCA